MFFSVLKVPSMYILPCPPPCSSQGMWELMVNNFNDGVAPDMEASFFVGDFAGTTHEERKEPLYDM